ncbi:sushi, von Willebrand factor type A, EGF and pentraxin domain-containing protein 1-like isoform X2 [Haliotis rufescens]|uniref:sushi, von Willebrand factor type A, EGF and pentraxin domain-containing protein 1-like isoform X2 n=1 Tax=Haliotis rufescens TaxID=6454 RepID=UPI00201F1017|nr:sushi, von Willebrand factor type A, EGF and pentraxin domain-containing protein 1-like isoform X2 [Haliotis rufescens]
MARDLSSCLVLGFLLVHNTAYCHGALTSPKEGAGAVTELGCHTHPAAMVPERCTHDLLGPVDTVKLWSSRGPFPSGSVCVFLLGEIHTCIRCDGVIWKQFPCSDYIGERRVRRQLEMGLLPGAVSPDMLHIMCQFFCNSMGSNPEASEHAGSGIYQLPAIVCPSVPSPIVAPPGRNLAVVKWQLPQANSADGTFLLPVPVSGSQASGSAFSEGRHTITYAVMDSTGFKDTCTFSFDVTVIRCGMPAWPRNGNRSCGHGDVIYGSTCSYTCDPGYTMEGKPRITCLYDGSFDFQPPTCRARTCPGLQLPQHGVGHQCTNSLYSGSVCVLVCSSVLGFQASPPGITSCLSTGAWTVPQPRCVDLLPPTFENCPDTSIVIQAEKGTTTALVTWPDIVAKDNSGYSNVQQSKGLAPGSRFTQGVTEVRYTAVDGSGNTAQPCSFTIIVEVPKCSVPSFKDRYMEADCPSGFNYGALCNISCRMGLPLEGATSITCEIDNSISPTAYWHLGTAPTPVCRERPCGDLSPPRNGAVVCDRWAGGTLCQMQCNEKYDVPRTVAISQHFVCAFSTGQWKPAATVPDCTELRRPKSMLLPSELYYYTGNCGSTSTVELVKTQFIMSLKGSGSWKDACAKDKNCKVENVQVECGDMLRRRRHAAMSSRRKRAPTLAALVTWDFMVDFEMGNMTVEDAINKHKDMLKGMASRTKIDVQQGLYDINITGFQLRHDSFASGWSDFYCGKGLVPVYASASCAACPTGTYYNNISDCAPCPLGMYQDKDGAFSCKTCPARTSSLTTGAKDIAECAELCGPGMFSPTRSLPCSPCPHGFYQPHHGAASCRPCPPGTTTQSTHNNNVSACTAYDVLVVGPISFNMRNALTDDLGDFTMATWIKTNAAGATNTAISITHPHRGTLVSLDLAPTSWTRHASNGNISSTIMFPVETWTHVELSWHEWRKELSVYVGGEPVVTRTFAAASSPLVTAGASLRVSTGMHSEVLLQGLFLLSSRRDAHQIRAMALTCDHPTERALFSLDDIPKTTSSSILVITPSTCDAIDECEPIPCPGHTCINRHGSYKCLCHDGFTGSNCTGAPDFCADNICYGGASCVNEVSNYTCICPPSFTGRYCQIEMIDVDGGWNLWTDWSTCSASCGGGWTVRMRECNSPPPTYNGKPCNGSSVEKKECNTNECPACFATDLVRGYGTRPTCVGDQHDLTCSVSCRDGLMFLENPPLYHCTGGIWRPSNHIIPCTRANSPKRLELRFEGRYKSAKCIDSLKANILSQKLKDKSADFNCLIGNMCNMTAKVESCLPITRHKRSSHDTAISLSVVLAVDVKEGDLDLESYHTHKTVSPQLASVLSAVKFLEATASRLKETDYAAFCVDDDYIVEDMAITSHVTCPAGFIARNAFCVACPMGAHFRGGRCLLCDAGTYQNEAGQRICHQCPPGRSTDFRGSTNTRQCTQIKTNPSHGIAFAPGESQKSPLDDVTNAPNLHDDGTAVIAIVVTICVVAVVVVGSFNLIIIYKKLKRDRKEYMSPPSWMWSLLRGSQHVRPSVRNPTTATTST